MATKSFTAPILIAHIVALAVMTLFVLFLTVTYMYLEFAHLRPLAMGLFAVFFCISNLLGGLALKRIGYSPWLGLTGFFMGMIPLILYIALPNKVSSSS